MTTTFKRIHNDINLLLIGKLHSVLQKYEGSRYYYSVWVDNRTKSLYSVLFRAMEDDDLPIIEVFGACPEMINRIETMIQERYSSEIDQITEGRKLYQKKKLAHVMTNGY